MAPKENDLEGVQDQGGKHGGQAGMPKPVRRPKPTKSDEDVPKRKGAATSAAPRARDLNNKAKQRPV
jgi:hypothetical protein